jgi:hypothetical protein
LQKCGKAGDGPKEKADLLHLKKGAHRRIKMVVEHAGTSGNEITKIVGGYRTIDQSIPDCGDRRVSNLFHTYVSSHDHSNTLTRDHRFYTNRFLRGEAHSAPHHKN